MKKGFTLVELIVVIIVLAIIVLVAFPRITDAIETAKEKTILSSVQNYVRALDEKIMNENIQDGTYDDTELIVDVTGDKPDSATIVVYNRGVVELTADYNNIPVSYNKEDGFRVIKYEVYKPGDVISYDVSTGKKCSTPSTDLTSKTGCMKFYVITTDDAKEKDYVDVILDHNTTDAAAWNEDKTVNKTNTRVMVEGQQTLESDTNGWKVYEGSVPRVINVQEILAITGNTTFNYSTATYQDFFYFDSNNSSTQATSTNKSKYWWLFDNTNNCLSYGCHNAYANTSGYWTSGTVQAFQNNDWCLVWHVRYKGGLVAKDGTYASEIGIRPVIKISKKVLENE